MRAPAAIAILSLAASALAAPAAAPPPGARLTIRATRLALDPGDPARVRVGGLRYLGGWALSSSDARFGGISSLIADRGAFTALTDEGMIVRFRLTPRGQVRDGRAMPLPAGPAARGKANGDSESMQRDPATGKLWVGFEGANAIWRYASGFAAGEASAAPPAMAAWPRNGGPEAMARLADGRFIVFSEEAPGPAGSTEALLFAGDPAVPGTPPLRFGYRAPRGYRVTDAAELPDGRLVLVNRRFTPLEGVSAIVTVADRRRIAEGSVMAGREIARLAPPLAVDNMEAVSVEREAGRTILWIASDDNFNRTLQRTLLLKFMLEAR